jgi:polar amino acid transport system permease protein
VEWDWEYAIEILPDLLDGLRLTVVATLAGIVVALVLGLGLALLRRSRNRLVRWPTAAIIEFIRSTPLLVQLFFLFYVLPEAGLVIPPFTAGVIGLGLHYATYTSEVYRSGIEGVPRGQWEASVACNLSATATWTRIILPQAIPRVIPALGNYLVAMFKEAPLLFTITVVELLATAQNLAASDFQPVESYTMAGVLFLAVSIPTAIGVRYLEKRFVTTSA